MGDEAQLTRRSFLGSVGVGAALAATINARAAHAAGFNPDATPAKGLRRRRDAFETRLRAARVAFERPLPAHHPNGEERDYPFVANFTKGLPHDALGEVDPRAYRALLHALETGDKRDFEAIPLGGARPLRNPQAGRAFDLEGPDSHHLAIPPAPRIDAPQSSSEMAELYWMALARDVAFTDYEFDPLTASASEDLSAFSDFRGPKQGDRVTPATLFRGFTAGDVAGPYVSQFLLGDVPYGTLTIGQRQLTFLPRSDFVTDFGEWLRLQRGELPVDSVSYDSTQRFVRNGRDLAAYVQIDALYQAYLNACLMLLGIGAPLDPGNPYRELSTTDGFATFGDPHVLSLVTEVATRALKAVWFQKWYVHRRQRPEQFGGRIHHHRTGVAEYRIDPEILDSAALDEIWSRHGSFLLPQAYPEGCPLHPAYGAGHATVAGACVTILKAWFDESYALPNPAVASADGTALVAYTGPDADALTVGGELDKLAANIAMGRNFAGIHWRTDYTESLRLGEAIALGVLEEQALCFTSPGAFSLTRFDGTRVSV
ncbi:MAG TPA: vanadium-dependent haloperoxidase [Myxococcota bacterium]|nr:vanadium-dependent haloperoxidase [Myxococcota bacterium]